jgi:AcrR family transcriptional regulator
MGRALFYKPGFLAAARAIACERGPAAVTIDSVTRRLGAPKGSFYYRFASRDALLGELWLEATLEYQERDLSRPSKPTTGSLPLFTPPPGRAAFG